MNKATLIAKVAEKSELSKKQAEAALNAFTDTISEALKAGDKVPDGLWHLRSEGARSPYRPQALHRRDHRDSRQEVPGIQGRQGLQGSVLRN